LRPLVRLQAPERQEVIQLLKAKAGSEPLTPEMLKDVAAEVIALRPAPDMPRESDPDNGAANDGATVDEPVVPAPAAPNAEATELAPGGVNRVTADDST